MSPLLAVLAELPTPLAECLRAALPNATNSEHADGWGTAVLGDEGTWRVGEHAASDAALEASGAAAAGLALVASLRKRSSGPPSSEAPSRESGQPFLRGRWVFAHDGAIEQASLLRSELSPARRDECTGRTASESLFAYLLGRLDAHGLTDSAASDETDRVIARSVTTLNRRGIRSLNFVMTDGTTLYAHRLGRPMYLLARLSIDAGSSALVASERITPEPWWSLADGALVRCRRGAALSIAFLAGIDPRTGAPSDFEIPFTD